MALLQVDNIQKSFGSNHVLKGVSFTLEKGQVLAIIGASGSGKTTLLRCLNFLETPDEGEISVGGQALLNLGQPLTDEQVRKNRLHFGLVFQKTSKSMRWSFWIRSDWEAKWMPIPISFLEANSSGSPLPGRLPCIPRYCALTNLPAHWIRNSPVRFCGSFGDSKVPTAP